MKKKIFIIIVIIVVCSLFALFVWQFINKAIERQGMNTLPDIELMTIEGKRFVFFDLLRTKKSTLFVFFHPNCDYCKMEMDILDSLKRQFPDINIVMVTIAPLEDVIFMQMKYNILRNPDIKILLDDASRLHTLFNIVAPPTFVIYDAAGKLVLKKKGMQSIDILIHYIEKANER